MSDFPNEDDRDLWRASQYSNIYGQESGQDYLMMARGLPPLILIVIVLVACFLKFILWCLLGGLLIIGALVFIRVRRDRRRAAAVRRHEVGIERLKAELQSAFLSRDAEAADKICQRLKEEDAIKVALPLLKMALADIDPSLRRCAVFGLQWCDGHWPYYANPDGSQQLVLEETPYAMLCGILNDERETLELRCAAAHKIGQGGLIEGYSAIKARLEDSPDEVRVACCLALGSLAIEYRDHNASYMSSRPDWKGFIRPDSLPLLRQLLDDPNESIRLEAINALGLYRDEVVLRRFQEMVADVHQSKAVRQEASYAVARIRQGAGF